MRKEVLLTENGVKSIFSGNSQQSFHFPLVLKIFVDIEVVFSYHYLNS